MTWYAACKKKGTWKEIGSTEDLVDYILTIHPAIDEDIEFVISLLSDSYYFHYDNAHEIVLDLLANNVKKVVRDMMIYDIYTLLKHHKEGLLHEEWFRIIQLDDDNDGVECDAVMYFAWDPYDLGNMGLPKEWFRFDIEEAWDHETWVTLYYDSDSSEFDNITI